MRDIAIATTILASLATPSLSQETTFKDLRSYCHAMSEASSPTLAVRIGGMSRAQAEEQMKGMTDPTAIRMVKEVIDFAYSQPASAGLDAMKAELKNRCISKKIFAQ
ncbi:hypothetical protein [Nitrobacter winogradskyi]|uniref:Uncharacterized protein n=1 Tax=Nitrobacter winogradskyi TaxID=913 RepID=A0ACC6AI16_NITWI|nr:hypothetical protein [Nitrobacter winogradskyi]MCP1999162.1 hypothetical protein [Nitrobacter winogradskyi]